MMNIKPSLYIYVDEEFSLLRKKKLIKSYVLSFEFWEGYSSSSVETVLMLSLNYRRNN